MSDHRMSDRDQFAMAAMQAILSKDGMYNEETREQGWYSPDEVADGAYEYADAMLRARLGLPPKVT